MAVLGASAQISIDEVYSKYVKEFHQQHQDLKDASPEQVAQIVANYQTKMAKELACNADVRQLEPSNIELLERAAREGQLLLMMRHGDQQKSETVQAISSSALQKIAMMRHDENANNPVTLESAIDSMGTLIVLSYIQQKTGKQFDIHSSSNQRALQPANALALMLDATVSEDHAKWDCIDYSDIHNDDAMLALLPTGALPWPKSDDDHQTIALVDKIAGKNTYTRISMQMGEALERKSDNNRVIISHTQQINALCQKLGLDIKRLQTFGFVLVPLTAKEKAVLLDNGLYDSNKPKLSLSYSVDVTSGNVVVHNFERKVGELLETDNKDAAKPEPRSGTGLRK